MKLDKWGRESPISASPGNVIIEDTNHPQPLLEGSGSWLCRQRERVWEVVLAEPATLAWTVSDGTHEIWCSRQKGRDTSAGPLGMNCTHRPAPALTLAPVPACSLSLLLVWGFPPHPTSFQFPSH